MNALYGGRLVWPLAKDTVVSVEIAGEKGGRLPATLPINGTVRLNARATYADGHKGEWISENVTFTSRDATVATISGNTLTWRHGGTALVTATINGVASPAASIQCAYAPESIAVMDESGAGVSALTLRVGEEKHLKVRVLPTEASQEFTATASNDHITIKE